MSAQTLHLSAQSIDVRVLGAADAEEYRAFRLQALRRTPTAFTSTYEEDRGKPLSATVDRLVCVDRPHDAVVGAFDGTGTLVGIAGLTVGGRVQERHKATLFGMAVAPHVGRRGIGRTLVERILQLAAQVDGLLQVGLTVSEGNLPAQRLYQRCGFRVWGHEPRAVLVDGHPVAKLHMVCRLDSDRT